MFLTVFLTLLFLFIVYLLFAPIDLFIDTATNQYYVQLKGLAKANIEAHQEELLRIKLRALFMKFYFYPLKARSTSKKKKIEQGRTKKKNKAKNIRKGLRMLRSFKMKRLLVDIDTGDCISNAKLYPVFALLNYHTGACRINFEGKNRMALHMRNRPIYIIKSFINF